MKTRKILKRAVLNSSAVVAMMACANAAQESTSSFDISAQPLDRALLEFNEQSDAIVMVPQNLVSGKSAPAVSGEMTANEALSELLRDSGLQLRSNEDGAFTIDRISAAPAVRSFRVAALGTSQISTSNAVVGFQDEEGEDSDVIVVTGFRRSIENSIAAKRNADTFIESISAEDIGRLPDISIADALSRLPGITSQRVSGQSSAINVRGLSQNLTFSTLNGREQVTPNGNRSVEFEQFPSELISGAEVYKSPKATLIEGGLAGTINMRTVRPLDQKDRVLNFNVRGSFNDRADEILDADDYGYRVSGVYVDSFADDTFGIALGYARLVQPDVSTRFVGFDYEGASVDFNGDGVLDAVPFGFEAEERGGEDTRDGYVLTTQWKPTENFNWETDVYYSKFSSDTFSRGVRITGTQEVNRTSTTLANPTVSNNALVGGTLSRNAAAPTDGGGFGLTAAIVNDNDSDEDELLSIGSKVEFETGSWKFVGDVSFSSAESTFANEVSAALPLSSLDGGVAGQCCGNTDPNTPVLDDDLTVSFLFDGTDIPSLSFSPDFTDRSTFYLSRLGLFPFVNEDELFAVAGSVSYDADWGVVSSVEVGFRYSDREAKQRRVSADFGNDAGFFQFSPALPPVALTEQNSSVECFSGDFADNGFPCFLAINDPRALAEGAVGTIVPDMTQGFTRTESFDVSEEVLAGFVQANLDTQIGSLPVRGNVGVRVVETDQQSQSLALPQAAGFEFTEVLPSLNLIFSLTDNQLVRFGAARTLSRAPLTQLGSGFNISFDSTQNRLTGGGNGNPLLDPFLANQIDIAYEYYTDNGGIFTAAYFHKDLDSLIFTETIEDFDFGAGNILDFLSPANRALLDASGISLVGQFSGPVNSDGGTISGVEFGYTQAFDFLPAPWDGFGVSANYSYTDSEINFTASNSGESLVLPLPGLSEHVFNPTMFYEKNGFSTRLSARYRSEFISPQIGINSQLPFTDEELVFDYQASYEFSEGPAEGLTVLFQANNLTDEPIVTYFGSSAQTGTLQHVGRQFLIGASYRF